MRPSHLLAPALIAGLTLTACDTSLRGEFDRVLPDDRVLINLPTDDASSARVGGWSEFYVLTADVTKSVNGLAGYVLVLVDTITDYPASSISDDGNTATWGPFADALDPVETQLWVTHEADDSWSWGFDQRPKNDEAAEWVNVVAGEVDAGATEAASRGRFSVDWTAMQSMNPTVHAVGTFAVDYDIGASGVSGTAMFDEVLFDGQTEVLDALYAYEQVYGGSGAMDLVVQADAEDTATDAKETLVIRSRWESTGTGRSDAYLSGGDLGELTATASECWDLMFQSVYYIDNYTPIEEGEIASCAFADAELPETE